MLAQEYNVGHTHYVSGVIRTLGVVFSGSFDGTVKVLEPTTSPSVIMDLCPHDGEVTKVILHQ